MVDLHENKEELIIFVTKGKKKKNSTESEKEKL
jgi:hypothetical protein